MIVSKYYGLHEVSASASRNSAVCTHMCVYFTPEVWWKYDNRTGAHPTCRQVPSENSPALSRHLERVTVGHSCLKSFLQLSANKHNLKLFLSTLPSSFCDCTLININMEEVSQNMLFFLLKKW